MKNFKRYFVVTTQCIIDGNVCFSTQVECMKSNDNLLQFIDRVKKKFEYCTQTVIDIIECNRNEAYTTKGVKDTLREIDHNYGLIKPQREGNNNGRYKVKLWYRVLEEIDSDGNICRPSITDVSEQLGLIPY